MIATPTSGGFTGDLAQAFTLPSADGCCGTAAKAGRKPTDRVRMFKMLVLLISTVLAMRALHAAPASQALPVVEARIKSGKIVLDGTLNQQVWQSAPLISLTQQIPLPGAPTPFTTTVRILRGQRHLYFRIVCTDPDPSKIAIHTLKRDGDQSNDDNVMIVLDTFDQKKLAYVFQVNAGGAMADGLISPGYVNPNTGSPVDYSWNGYWKAAVKRTATGWIAEIAIDTQSLQYNRSHAAWGLNISRYVPRDQLTLAWSGINLNASVTNLQWEGTLTGMENLSQGTGLEFDPYVLTEYSNARHNASSRAGFDLKYNLTPGLAGLLTYHTDFSEAAVNAQQVIVSPFQQAIPETRAFFLDGANIFSFGHNLGQNFIPFYSRNIGLVKNTPVPLNEGAKVLGHVDGWTLGMLDTQMASTPVSNATNLLVGRASYNINKQWRMGMLITRGTPTGHGTNILTSFDSTWSTSTLDGDKNLNVSGWGAHSSGNDLPTGTANGYGVDVEYPNNLWYADLNYNYYGNALDPALGFIQRPGTRQTYVQLVYQPRPASHGRLSWIRQLFFNGNFQYVTGLNDRLQSEDWQFTPINFITQTGWMASIWLCPSYEVVTSPYEIVPGVSVPLGRYHFSLDTLNINTPESAAWVFSLQAKVGGLYNGTARVVNTSLSWSSPGGHFTAAASSGVTWFRSLQGNDIVRVAGLNLGYSFTPDLTLSTLTQYNNISRNTSTSMRLDWIIQPNRNLYVVWNHGLTLNPELLQGQQVISGNTVTVKLLWGLF